MNTQSGVANVVLLVIVFACATGYAYYKASGEADSPYEETMEYVAEHEVENLLDLPKDSLKDKIDLSPNSKEK